MSAVSPVRFYLTVGEEHCQVVFGWFGLGLGLFFCLFFLYL